MATAITPQTAVSSRLEVRENRFVIPRVSWENYEALLRIVGGQRSIRVTYVQGMAELMSPLPIHERFGYLLGRVVQTVTEELNIEIACTRSTTFRREDLDRGLEADDSYYIANAHRVPDADRIDLAVTPPPDLAIEVEISNSILDRLEIYAALGVPELWRFDGEKLTVLILGRDGKYAESLLSQSFPFLPIHEVTRFLLEHVPGEDTRWAKSFRAWVRDVLLPPYRADRDQE